MFFLRRQRRGRNQPVQAARAPVWRAWRVVLAGSLAAAVAGCARNPVLTPVDWWHDLQGGEIAATRPPPPGANLPYPHLGTIPARPVLPTPAFRDTVRTELVQQRDTTERLAARTPIDIGSPPPPPAPPPPRQADAPAAASDNTANATLPAADAAPSKAPAGPRQAAQATAPDGGPAPGTPVTFAGAPVDSAGLPDIPAAPPAPASFEAVLEQAEPAPALPLPAPAADDGARVLFATGDAVLNPSQGQTIGETVGHRGRGSIAIEGHGDAAAQTPGAQQAALELGLKRAHAIAEDLLRRHVPADRILLSATAFGRDATLRVIPGT